MCSNIGVGVTQNPILHIVREHGGHSQPFGCLAHEHLASLGGKTRLDALLVENGFGVIVLHLRWPIPDLNVAVQHGRLDLEQLQGFDHRTHMVVEDASDEDHVHAVEHGLLRDGHR